MLRSTIGKRYSALIVSSRQFMTVEEGRTLTYSLTYFTRKASLFRAKPRVVVSCSRQVSTGRTSCTALTVNFLAGPKKQKRPLNDL